LSKNVLVTGGAGFIGSHVVDYLLMKGHNVRVIDSLENGFKENVNKEAEFLKGNLRNRSDCKKAVKGIDVVMHLAAHAAEIQSIYVPIFDVRANVLSFMNLAVESINAGVETFLFTSTMAVYGNQKVPFTEDMNCNPKDVYGIAKRSIEQYLQVFKEVFGLNM
jgi:UDP-glucose 4-epimerase